MNNICVLIPHFNNIVGLKKSLKSIKETLPVSILVVDDGSNVRPDYEALLECVSENISLDVIYFLENRGIVDALNFGVQLIEARRIQFIGRLDAGDINYPERFTKQVEFLLDNKDFSIVGGWVNFVEENSGKKLFTLKHPVSNDGIQKAKYRFNPFVHPCTVMRTSAIVDSGYYPEEFPSLEDYALFFRLLEIGKGYNLPEVLIDYEISENSISTTKRFEQSKSKFKLLFKEYKLGVNSSIGLLKTALILLLPRGLLTYIKSKLYRN